jgi:hypothetical protein
MVSIVRLQEAAVETAVASGINCTDSSYDGNLLIIATSTATSTAPVKSATSPVKSAAKASPKTIITASTATKSTKSKSTHIFILLCLFYFII